jgi:hypothetical protein
MRLRLLVFSVSYPRVVLAVGALCVFALAACATAPASPPKLPEVDVTGNWEGEWRGPQGAGLLSLTLKQDGAKVTGQMALTDGPPELRSAPVTGEVSGKSFSFSSTGLFRADLSVTGDEMSGPFVYRLHNTMSLKRIK